MTMVIDYGRCECECGECAFARHCHHGGFCHVGYDGPCTCGQCVSPFATTPKAGPHPPATSVPCTGVAEPRARRESPTPASGRWSLSMQRRKAGEPRRYRVVGPWRSSLEDVERDMKLVADR